MTREMISEALRSIQACFLTGNKDKSVAEQSDMVLNLKLSAEVLRELAERNHRNRINKIFYDKMRAVIMFVLAQTLSNDAKNTSTENAMGRARNNFYNLAFT